jgi:ligand-binding SRPBCC domain-containing protein
VSRREFSVTSRLHAPRQEVWERVSTMAGVNDELAPLLSMTHPPQIDSLDPSSVPLGRPLFRSWIKLARVFPFDYDDLVLVRVDPGEGFLERSTMLSQRSWEHERTLRDAAGGCELTDRIAFEPRVAALGGPLRPVLRAFFRHRHRRLRRRFGGQEVGRR